MVTARGLLSANLISKILSLYTFAVTKQFVLRALVRCAVMAEEEADLDAVRRARIARFGVR